MGTLVSWVSAFTAVALDIVLDADFAVIRGAEGTIGEFRPSGFPVTELDWVGVVAVMEEAVPPLTTEDAAQREGVPLAARRKGT